jgi:hypothetical protein
LSPASGIPGTRMAITVSGFPPNGIVAQYIDVLNPRAGSPQPLFLGTPIQVNEQGRHEMHFSWPPWNEQFLSKPGPYSVCADHGGEWSSDPQHPTKYPITVCTKFVVLKGAASPPSPATLAAARLNRSGPPLLGLLAALVVLVPAVVAGLIRLVRNPTSRNEKHLRDSGGT